ncbi:MAG: hypothetical protein ACT4N5_01395 [Nitrosopumilaceae archaeon]
MSYRIEDFENDPTWTPSLGEKLGMIHFRNGHWHAECDPNTRLCNIHYDEHDPYESPTSLYKHVSESKLGAGVLFVGTIALLDHIFNNGRLRKKIQRSLFD